MLNAKQNDLHRQHHRHHHYNHHRICQLRIICPVRRIRRWRAWCKTSSQSQRQWQSADIALSLSANRPIYRVGQKTVTYSDMKYTSLTPDKILNSLVYRALFYANTYASYELLKTVRVFWPTLYIATASWWQKCETRTGDVPQPSAIIHSWNERLKSRRRAASVKPVTSEGSWRWG